MGRSHLRNKSSGDDIECLPFTHEGDNKSYPRMLESDQSRSEWWCPLIQERYSHGGRGGSNGPGVINLSDSPLRSTSSMLSSNGMISSCERLSMGDYRRLCISVNRMAAA